MIHLDPDLINGTEWNDALNVLNQWVRMEQVHFRLLEVAREIQNICANVYSPLSLSGKFPMGEKSIHVDLSSVLNPCFVRMFVKRSRAGPGVWTSGFTWARSRPGHGRGGHALLGRTRYVL